jgi:hypothetical protein
MKLSSPQQKFFFVFSERRILSQYESYLSKVKERNEKYLQIIK